MKRQDYYYRLAKKEHYKSRAAYKLMHIDDRFYIFKKGKSVLDLGASPGGWSQVAKERTYGGAVFSVDIKPVHIEGITYIKGNVFDDEIINKIKEKMVEKNTDGFDVILSDMSPKISGVKEVDHQQSLDLGRRALEISKQLLKVGGSLIIKLFYGQDIFNIKKEVEAFFDFCKFYTPPSSRKGSREVYMVCKRFKKTI
ncbi:MAG: SAM-dependent methyltransferase [Thermoplasmata archaeon]|nr:RlmE family RNA methyltransferase [Thermoplasmata archaeon]